MFAGRVCILRVRAVQALQRLLDGFREVPAQFRPGLLILLGRRFLAEEFVQSRHNLDLVNRGEPQHVLELLA